MTTMESTSSAASTNGKSPGATVCYLADGTDGRIDRLSLALPLTSSHSSGACSLSSLHPTESSSTFSPSHSLFESALSHTDYLSSSEADRTPVNTEKDFVFSPSAISQSSSSSSSSCRTMDSGTESICSDAGMDDRDYCVSDRILKFFASAESNGKAREYRGGRRPTGANLCLASAEHDDDQEEEEDIYSDESTLSESSLSPAEFDSERTLITPESVVAAIDAKIKRGEAAARQLATGDTTGCQSTATDCTLPGDTEVCRVQTGGPPFETAGSDPTLFSLPLAAQAERPLFGSTGDNRARGDLELETDAGFEEDDSDGDYGRRARLIRSTSLKTGKTPPGTPGSKKFVRFADALGLDLESVRHIVDDGCPYMPPMAAFKGLKLDDDDKQWLFGQQTAPQSISHSPSPSLAHTSPASLLGRPNLRILFGQPSSDPGPFLERVRSHKLCLENCIVTGPSGPSDMFTLTCIARVLNIGFEKSLTLRYTTNEWLTWTDVLASYIANSCDGFSDKFTVTFHVAVNSNGHQSMMPGQRLLFALKYCANSGQEYWDNNMGLNYSLIYQRN